jgi:hypothetical protein
MKDILKLEREKLLDICQCLSHRLLGHSSRHHGTSGTSSLGA